MARVLNITVPEAYTEKIISQVKDKEGLLSLALQKQASLKPPGDILTLSVTNTTLHSFIQLLESYKMGQQGGITLRSSEPDSIITNEPDYRIEKDGQEATWEEVEMVISKDSNMKPNILVMMAMAGVISITGLATSTIHVVIGGMLLAPGFMPIMRTSLGLANNNRYWYYGMIETVKGYFSLMAGALIAGLLLKWSGIDPLSPDQEYYQVHNTLIDYWTNINAAALLSSVAATVVGVLLLMTKRTIFTSGVMIALALIPAAALIPVCLASGEYKLAGKAALRFGTDLVLISGISFLIFSIKQKWIHKRGIKL